MKHGKRKIPARVVYSGDVAEARKLRGEADSQLCILEDQMRLASQTGGKKQEIGSRRITLPNDGYISCVSCFDLHAIVIHVPKFGITYDKFGERECYCWPCFSQGVVTAIHDFANVTSFAPVSYSVEICYDKGVDDVYVAFENMCFASDCAQYIVGQPVIVSAAPDTSYDMCHFLSMGASWLIIFPLNPSEEQAAALKWEKNYDKGRAFRPQVTE